MNSLYDQVFCQRQTVTAAKTRCPKFHSIGINLINRFKANASFKFKIIHVSAVDKTTYVTESTELNAPAYLSRFSNTMDNRLYLEPLAS